MSANANQIELFPGFAHSTVPVGRDLQSGDEIAIHCAHGGSGPPVLLLHGFPQTHSIWHQIAGRLAANRTVVCADLRGYGDSSKPKGTADHATYSKRAMALDQVRLMELLGFQQFAVVGHDRGGRVAHRMARDHRDRVTRMCVIDIVPTLTMFEQTDMNFARDYYHWFFLIQPAPHPEHMIGADPKHYLRWKTGGWGSSGHSQFDPRAYAEYERCYCDPATIHASCEDYRAAATIDLEHDREHMADRIACPVLALWGARGVIQRLFKPLQDWGAVAADVRGKSLPAGHYIPEEVPDLLLAELVPFLAETDRRASR